MTSHPLFRILAGFTVWAIAFLLLYAVQATGCRLGWQAVMIGPVSTLRLVLLAGLCITLAALVLTGYRFNPPAEGNNTLSRIARLANGAAILAALCFSGIAWLTMC